MAAPTPNTTTSRPRLVINGRFLARAPTGVDRVAAQVVSALCAMDRPAGAPELVIAAPPNAAAPPAELADRVRKCGRLVGALWEQIDLPRLYRDDVIVNFCNTAPAAHRANVVVIHDALVFDAPHSYAPAFRLWYRLLLPWIAARAKLVITVSNHSRERLTAHGVTAKTVAVIPNGADHLAAAPMADQAPGGVTEPFALFVGSPARHKNFDRFSALARLFRARLDFVAVGVADSAVFGKTGGRASFVRRLGRVSDSELKYLYAHAHCLVFPSIEEGFGFPPLEAMGLGCPVVCADRPVMREVLGAAPLYVRDDDLFGWVAAIEGLRDAALRAEVTARSAARAAAFTWSAAGARYADALDAAAS